MLVTAGGTREAIDSVRFIGNRSSGRMGVALAEAAARRGADVTLVAANVSLPISPRDRGRPVETRRGACRGHPQGVRALADVLLMAAAVADFRPETAEGKLAREGSGGMELRLTETEDVVASLAGERQPEQTLVGFAAEHGAEAISRAREKLERKGLDAIVFNDISRPEIGFDSERNEVTIVTAGERARRAGEHRRKRSPKPSSTRSTYPSGRSYTSKSDRLTPPTRCIARGWSCSRTGRSAAATVPLAEAAKRAPEKTSVREALGRAYFRNRQFAEAATEFEAVVESAPVNDYAHFCLGRALSMTGETKRARHHLALASNLQPAAPDYRLYRDRARRAA